MQCPIEADPPAMIEWKKDGESIHFGWERYSTKNNDYILQVKDLEKSDSGVYQCDAVNGFGSVEVAFNVIVFSPGTRTHQDLHVMITLTGHTQTVSR